MLAKRRQRNSIADGMPPKKAAPKASELTEDQINAAKALAEKDLAIEILTEAVKRHQESENLYTERNGELTIELKRCQGDLYDINEFLLNELKAQSLLTAEVQDNLRAANASYAKAAEAHKCELEAANQKHAADIAELERQIADLQARSDEAAEYLNDKADLLKQLKTMSQARETERGAASKRISQLEHQALEDIDKAQKDLAIRVTEAREQTLVEAGGKILVQNRVLEQALAEHSLQLEKVVAKNSELSTGNSSLRREVAALQELQAAFAARCHAAQKAVQKLVAEKDAVQGLWEEAESARKAAQTKGSDLRKCLEASKQAQEQLQTELDAQLQKSTTAEQRIALLEERCDEAVRLLKQYGRALAGRGVLDLNDAAATAEAEDRLVCHLHQTLAGTPWLEREELGSSGSEEGVVLPPVPAIRWTLRSKRSNIRVHVTDVKTVA